MIRNKMSKLIRILLVSSAYRMMMLCWQSTVKIKKTAWKSYHEKHLNIELARPMNNLSQADAVSRDD